MAIAHKAGGKRLSVIPNSIIKATISTVKADNYDFNDYNCIFLQLC
jgi:hypothetical protein